MEVGKNIKNVVESENNMVEELKKEDKIQLQRDIVLTDILLRLTSLERILLEKKLISNEEYGEIMQKVLKEMHKAVEDAGFTDVANLLSIKMPQN